MNPQSFEFVTDTSSMCIFDLEALRHRLSDDYDWWILVEEELMELNAGNAAIVGLGADGQYQGQILQEISWPAKCVFRLRCPSGRVFVGAAEEITADGLEPEAIRGGIFLQVTPGVYQVSVDRDASQQIAIVADLFAGPVENHFESPLRL